MVSDGLQLDHAGMHQSSGCLEIRSSLFVQKATGSNHPDLVMNAHSSSNGNPIYNHMHKFPLARIQTHIEIKIMKLFHEHFLAFQSVGINKIPLRKDVKNCYSNWSKSSFAVKKIWKICYDFLKT